ncbi:MAG: TIGR03086 family metal-binding protein [Ilumatobacteraceae bacterium]
MTNTEATTVARTAPAMPDPRPALARAMALAGETIAAVRPDQLDLRVASCPEFDVRELSGHMLFALRRIAAVARGEIDTTDGFVVRGVADDSWASLWQDAVDQVTAVFADDAILGRMLALPFATLPGAVAAGIYVSEMTTHTWDLARATGQAPVFDDDVCELSLAVMTVGLPAEGREGEVPFDAPVPVAGDAPAIDRLVGWVGRRP